MIIQLESLRPPGPHDRSIKKIIHSVLVLVPTLNHIYIYICTYLYYIYIYLFLFCYIDSLYNIVYTLYKFYKIEIPQISRYLFQERPPIYGLRPQTLMRRKGLIRSSPVPSLIMMVMMMKKTAQRFG